MSSYVILYRDRDGEPHKRQPVGRWNTLRDAERMAQRLADSGCTDVELWEERKTAVMVRRFGTMDGLPDDGMADVR